MDYKRIKCFHWDLNLRPTYISKWHTVVVLYTPKGKTTYFGPRSSFDEKITPALFLKKLTAKKDESFQWKNGPNIAFFPMNPVKDLTRASLRRL